MNYNYILAAINVHCRCLQDRSKVVAPQGQQGYLTLYILYSKTTSTLAASLSNSDIRFRQAKHTRRPLSFGTGQDTRVQISCVIFGLKVGIKPISCLHFCLILFGLQSGSSQTVKLMAACLLLCCSHTGLKFKNFQLTFLARL